MCYMYHQVIKIISILFQQNKSILTITGVPSYVEGGISIGLGLKSNSKPEILVNMGSIKSEKHDISSQLLKLAKIVK
jgi:hypothetical protein